MTKRGIPEATSETSMQHVWELFAELLLEGPVITVVTRDMVPTMEGLPVNPEKTPGVDSVAWAAKANIPDLEFDEEGVRGTLEFASESRWVDVPWGAVRLMVGAQGAIVPVVGGLLIPAPVLH